MGSLEDIYQLSMIIVGFGGLILGYITLMRNIKRERARKSRTYNKRK